MLLAPLARADPPPIRIAQYHVDLTRDGPGLVLRDILSREDAQVEAMLAVIAAVAPDIFVVQDIDMDAGGATVSALAGRLEEIGLPYPHRLGHMGNGGQPTGHDLDGDGRSDRARDAHGYGRYSGEGGMAMLSRHPFGTTEDFSGFLWSDLPDTTAPRFTDAAALEVLRLHTIGALRLPVVTQEGRLDLLISHAGAPVFDGPEDRNGWRNSDEIRFWHLWLDGWRPGGGAADPGAPFLFAGTLNVDPDRGEGRRQTLRAFLRHPALTDPVPRDGNGRAETVDWEDPDPGDLRVDYLLPGTMLEVAGGGVFSADDATALGLPPETVRDASAHRLVWLDLRLPTARAAAPASPVP